jgi:hypothetical protein
MGLVHVPGTNVAESLTGNWQAERYPQQKKNGAAALVALSSCLLVNILWS